MTYTIRTFEVDGREQLIRDEDGAFIPPDEANADYVTYLDWIAEGNEPNAETVPAAMPDPLAAARASGIAKLMALGLTEVEALAIAGNNSAG